MHIFPGLPILFGRGKEELPYTMTWLKCYGRIRSNIQVQSITHDAKIYFSVKKHGRELWRDTFWWIAVGFYVGRRQRLQAKACCIEGQLIKETCPWERRLTSSRSVTRNWEINLFVITVLVFRLWRLFIVVCFVDRVVGISTRRI